MKRLVISLLLISVASAFAQGPSRGESITMHIECEPNAKDCITLPDSSGSLVSIPHTPDLVLDPQSITKLTPEPDPYGQPTLSVSLVPEKAAALAELTERNVRRRLAIVFNQRVLMAPVIQQRIDGGRFQISAGGKTKMFWQDIPWMNERIVTERTAETWSSNRNLWIYALLGLTLVVGTTLFAFRAPKS